MIWSLLKPRSLLVRVLLLLFSLPWLYALWVAFQHGWTVAGRRGAVADQSTSAFGFYLVCGGDAVIASLCLIGVFAPNPRKKEAPKPPPAPTSGLAPGRGSP